MAVLHGPDETPRNYTRAGEGSSKGTGTADNGRTLSPRARAFWTAAQYAVLLGGVVLVWLLIFRPGVGTSVMWNILTAGAPALVTIVPGLWRNICPMATFALLPRRLGLSKRRKMPDRLAGWLGLTSVALLFVIVPLRHIGLDSNGPMTAVLLMSAAAVAGLMGFVFEWRSGWCSSLCPIHPVERLYGSAPAISFQNARCDLCERCSKPCPNSTPATTPAFTGPLQVQKAVGNFLAGSFLGFVWGWFQVPDYPAPAGMHEIAAAYLWPLGGALVSYSAFKAIEPLVAAKPAARRILHRAFAATAVSTYYWYSIPALAGFGTGPAQLSGLASLLPAWFPLASHVVTTSFFFWFLVIRPANGRSWQNRPALVRVR